MAEIDPVSWLEVVAHPDADLVADYVADCIDDESVARQMLEHLVLCRRCRALAESFGWSVSNVESNVVEGPWSNARSLESSAARRGGRLAARPVAFADDVTLAVAAATDVGSGSSSQSADSMPAAAGFLPMVPAIDGKGCVGYVRGIEDVVLVRDAGHGNYLALGGQLYDLGPTDADGLRVAEGLTQEILTVWMADVEDNDELGPEIV